MGGRRKTYRAGGASCVAFATALSVLLNRATAATSTTTTSRRRRHNRARRNSRRGPGPGLASRLAARAGASGDPRRATGVHGRTRGDVSRERGVDVDEDPGVAGPVGAGEGDGGRAGAAAAADRELEAGHVQLGAARAAGGVEGDRLGAQEVVARGDVGGDLDVELAAAGVEVLDAPEVVVPGTARGVLGPRGLEHLEPARGAVGRRGVRDLGHVHHDGSVVGTSDSFAGARAVSVLLRTVSHGGAEVRTDVRPRLDLPGASPPSQSIRP